jgi:GNAT superfamily N-acetyltransferase
MRIAEAASWMTRGEPDMEIRTAGRADLDGLTRLLTEAFVADPLWSWAFPDPSDLKVWCRFYINSALRYPCVWILGDYAAASVWIPPSEVELSDDEEQRVEPLLTELLGTRAGDVLTLLESFDEAHPRSEPHYYLSLLGTANRHRGQGLGMALLAENLQQVDAQGAAAYLESSNPTNDRRYAAVGFRPTGGFTTPDGERAVTTMWRDPPLASHS